MQKLIFGNIARKDYYYLNDSNIYIYIYIYILNTHTHTFGIESYKKEDRKSVV